MFERFKPKMKPGLLGIDCRKDSIKWIEMSKNKKQYVMKDYGALASQNPIDLSFLKELSVQYPRAMKVAMAIPDSLTRRKIIQVSKSLKPKEIDGFIRLELEQLFFCPLKDIAYDTLILESDSTHPLDDLLIVGLLKEEIDKRVSALRQARFLPLIITLESYAFKRAICRLEGNKAQTSLIGLFVQQDNRYLLIVFKAEMLCFTHEIRVQESFFEASLEALSRFFSATAYTSIHKLWLSSDRPDLDEISQALYKKTGIPTAIAHCTQEATEENKLPPSYLLAYGLSLLQ